jgi:hypothetical protein
MPWRREFISPIWIWCSLSNFDEILHIQTGFLSFVICESHEIVANLFLIILFVLQSRSYSNLLESVSMCPIWLEHFYNMYNMCTLLLLRYVESEIFYHAQILSLPRYCSSFSSFWCLMSVTKSRKILLSNCRSGNEKATRRV